LIELTHIGETLIAKMFNSSQSVRKLIGDKAGIPLIDKDNITAMPEVSLARSGPYIFDGAHRVDVGVLLPGTLQCLPIEAKMGTDRLSRNEFEKRFLQPCGTSHGGNRLTGSMISILEKKLPASAGEKIEVRSNGIIYQLTQEWILVVRKQVLSSWHARGTPSLSPNCKILTIEEIASAYGDYSAFNDLVGELFSADYYHQWFDEEVLQGKA